MIPHRLRYHLGTLLVRLAVWLMQPAPVQTGGPSIHDLVIADLIRQGHHALAAEMLDRKRLGLAKYGTILQAGNCRDPLLDAFQESGDHLAYVRAALELARGPGPKRRLRALYAGAIRQALDTLGAMGPR